MLVDALREIPGVAVIVLSQVGGSCPDLLVAYAGINTLLEVKDKGGKLSDDQALFFASWPGRCFKVETLGEALIAIGLQ